jgi:hypothetical protein
VLAALFAWGFLALPGNASRTPTAASVGVLEDVPNDDPDKPHTRRVRVLFHFEGDAWTAFPHFPDGERALAALAGAFPKRVRWSVCLGGRSLGRLDGRAAARFEHYSEVGLQQPVRAGAPTVGAPDARFSGFDSTPVLRPLVATSAPRCMLPEAWTPVPSPPVDVKSRVTAALPDTVRPLPAGVPSYTWPATYRGPDGHWIVEVHREWTDLEDQRVVFVRPGTVTVAQGEPKSHMGRQGKSAPLAPGSIHPQLIVDTGDWNGDGKVEVLTKFEMYDLDGYILSSAEGEPLATFDWFYH